MANEEQLKRLLDAAEEGNGCKTWNEWRVKNLDIEIDLQDANLEGASLQRANLGGSYQGGAYLGGAYLVGSNLQRASLEVAILGGANLQRANLQRANLQYANLQRAKLKRANLLDVKNLIPTQVSQCQSITKAKYLSAEFLAEVKKLNPELVKPWWHENMIKETDHQGNWTGNWIEPPATQDPCDKFSKPFIYKG